MSEYQTFDVFLRLLDFLVLPALWYFAKVFQAWREDVKKEEQEKAKLDEAMRCGVSALLEDRICQSGHYFASLGAIPSRVKRSLVRMDSAYTDLQGNRRTCEDQCNKEVREIMEQVKELTVDDNTLVKTKGRCN